MEPAAGPSPQAIAGVIRQPALARLVVRRAELAGPLDGGRVTATSALVARAPATGSVAPRWKITTVTAL
jgi:hypothetical protein